MKKRPPSIMGSCELIDRVIELHGGRAAWAAVDAIHARLSTGGLAYATRGLRRSGIELQVEVQPAERVVRIADYPRRGWSGCWHDDHVWIGLPDGTGGQSRPRARDRFRGWLRHPLWDALDLLYFLGYALWNYLSFPILLDHPGTRARIVRDGRSPVLAVRFPADLPTHSPDQRFHLDADGSLRRHDYVAEVFGRWAAGANHCLRAETVDGLRFYTRRRVLPLIGGRVVLPGPTLVWIHLDEIRVRRRTRAAATSEPLVTSGVRATAAEGLT